MKFNCLLKSDFVPRKEAVLTRGYALSSGNAEPLFVTRQRQQTKRVTWELPPAPKADRHRKLRELAGTVAVLRVHLACAPRDCSCPMAGSFHTRQFCSQGALAPWPRCSSMCGDVELAGCLRKYWHCPVVVHQAEMGFAHVRSSNVDTQVPEVADSLRRSPVSSRRNYHLLAVLARLAPLLYNNLISFQLFRITDVRQTLNSADMDRVCLLVCPTCLSPAEGLS